MGQGFESLRARHLSAGMLFVVGVVQRLERQVVALEIVGSNPIAHPTFFFPGRLGASDKGDGV